MPVLDSRPLVSVVMASYNSAPYIGTAIRSVINQSYPYWELHVIDDGSSDDSVAAIEPFLQDTRIHLHCQENRGQASAKNRGLLAARGEFIAFLDADDLWSADKLEKQLPGFDMHPDAGIIHTNVMLISENGEFLGSPRRTYPQGWISGDLLFENCVNGMASIVPRKCIERIGIFDESLAMGIDYDLWLRISARYPIFYMDVVTYFYRQWGGQMSHRYEQRMAHGIRIMSKFLREHEGLLSRDVIRKAWAQTFVNRGSARFRGDGRWLAALRDYAIALSHKPAYWPAWKAIVKLALCRP